MDFDPFVHGRQSIRLPGYDYSIAGAYFITICTHQRELLFGDILDGEMQENKIASIVRSHWLNLPRHYANLITDEFVIMPTMSNPSLKLFRNSKHFLPEK
jgi:putative transposase